MVLSKVDGVNLTTPYIRRIPRVLTYPVFNLLQEKFHVSRILAQAGVRKGPGNKLTESATSFKNRGAESSGSSFAYSTEVKHTASGRRLLENGTNSGSYDNNEALEVVVEGVPSGTTVGRHVRSPRLEPLPKSYTSKHSIRSWLVWTYPGPASYTWAQSKSRLLGRQ